MVPKMPYIHKDMLFSSITNMAFSCEWLLPRSHLWSELHWLLGILNSTIVILTLNILYVKAKTFFRCWKTIHSWR